MSAFPMACNVVHARRYGNARQSMRQVSEPDGVSHEKHNSKPIHHHQSAEMPTFNHIYVQEPGKDNEGRHSALNTLTRHVQHSLNLGHFDQAPTRKKSVSMNALSKPGLLALPLHKTNTKSVNLETLESSFDDPIRVAEIPGQDSGFGSAFNLQNLGLTSLSGSPANRFGIHGTTGSFLKAQTDSIIDALQSFAVAQSQQN